MSQILICELEQSVIDRLKMRAKEHKRSLEAEVRLILTESVTGHTTDSLLEVKQIRNLFAERQFSDSTDLLREDRSR